MQYHARCRVCGRVTERQFSLLHISHFMRDAHPTDKLCCGKYMVQAGRLRPVEGNSPYNDLPMRPATILVDEIRKKIVRANGHGNTTWYLEAEMK